MPNRERAEQRQPKVSTAAYVPSSLSCARLCGIRLAPRSRGSSRAWQSREWPAAVGARMLFCPGPKAQKRAQRPWTIALKTPPAESQPLILLLFLPFLCFSCLSRPPPSPKREVADPTRSSYRSRQCWSRRVGSLRRKLPAVEGPVAVTGQTLQDVIGWARYYPARRR